MHAAFAQKHSDKRAIETSMFVPGIRTNEQEPYDGRTNGYSSIMSSSCDNTANYNLRVPSASIAKTKNRIKFQSVYVTYNS